MPFLHRPSSRRLTSTKFCVWGRIPDIFLGFEFHQNRLKNVGVVGGGRNFGLSIDLAHLLQQLVAIAQAVMQFMQCGGNVVLIGCRPCL